MNEPIRVVVVDDHPVFRLGLVGLLDTLPGIRVVGQAGSAAQARTVALDDVDVVLMDLHLGDGSGIDVTRDLVRAHPELKVLVVTMHEEHDSVAAAVRAGARGYVLKDADPHEVERALRAVANGELILGPGVAQRAMEAILRAPSGGALAFPELTQREREVLDLVARGMDNAGISRRLMLSPKTVRNNVSNVLAKMGARDRSEAIVRARDAGLGLDRGWR